MVSRCLCIQPRPKLNISHLIAGIISQFPKILQSIPTWQTDWPRRVGNYSRQQGVRRLINWDKTPCRYTLMMTTAYSSETSVYVYTSQHATVLASWCKCAGFIKGLLLLQLQQPRDGPAEHNKVKDRVPEPIFTLFETEFSEGQAREFAHATIPDHTASIPQDCTLHCHRRENIKSHMAECRYTPSTNWREGSMGFNSLWMSCRRFTFSPCQESHQNSLVVHSVA
jgi:hypothetical protein